MSLAGHLSDSRCSCTPCCVGGRGGWVGCSPTLANSRPLPGHPGPVSHIRVSWRSIPASRCSRRESFRRPSWRDRCPWAGPPLGGHDGFAPLSSFQPNDPELQCLVRATALGDHAMRIKPLGQRGGGEPGGAPPSGPPGVSWWCLVCLLACLHTKRKTLPSRPRASARHARSTVECPGHLYSSMPRRCQLPAHQAPVAGSTRALQHERSSSLTTHRDAF